MVESLLSIGAGAVAGEKNRSRSKTDRLRNSYGEDRGGNKYVAGPPTLKYREFPTFFRRVTQQRVIFKILMTLRHASIFCRRFNDAVTR